MNKIRKKIKSEIIKNAFSYVEGASWKEYEDIIAHDKMTEKEIQDYKLRKLKKIIEYAYKNIPFYTKLYKSKNISPEDLETLKDIEKFPIITKEDLKRNFPQKIIVNKNKKGLVHDATSGTTGTPYEFYTTRHALGLKKAILYRSWKWLGFSLGDRYVRVWSLIDHSNKGNIKKRAYNLYTKKVYSRLEIGSQDLVDKEKIKKQIKKIITFKPLFLTGLISSILIIADYLKINNIKLPKIPVLVYGETLTDNKRKFLEKNLSPFIYCEYGLGETRSFAFECKKKEGLHITESVHVEIINKGKCVKYGEKGKVVITDLDNYAMPFIRYDTNDISSFSKNKCSCGRPYPLLDKIFGRESEHVLTRDGKIMGLNHFTQLIGHDYKTISKWQVLQESYDTLTIKIVPTKKFTEQNKNRLIRNIQKYLGKSISINIKTVANILPTKTGKNILIISNIKKW